MSVGFSVASDIGSVPLGDAQVRARRKRGRSWASTIFHKSAGQDLG
jgi:hypothetical protein